MKPPSLKVRLLVRLCALLLFNLSLHPVLTGFVRGAELRSDGEWQRTVEAAKKEGKVSVFLYQRENIEAAVRVFEKRFPDIQVISASTPAAETGPRLMAERRAGKFLWDVCL